MFDDDQHRAFRMNGFVRLPGALPEAAVGAMGASCRTWARGLSSP